MSATEVMLIEKIRQLAPWQRTEVEDFIDFLNARDAQRLTRAVARASEPSFAAVWDKEEDAAYDKL